MPSTVAPQIARPVRTGVQLVGAGVVVEFIDAFFADLSDKQYAALLGLLTVVFGFIQVLVEDRLGKGFLRQPPDTPVEVVEETPPPVEGTAT